MNTTNFQKKTELCVNLTWTANQCQTVRRWCENAPPAHLPIMIINNVPLSKPRTTRAKRRELNEKVNENSQDQINIFNCIKKQIIIRLSTLIKERTGKDIVPISTKIGTHLNPPLLLLHRIKINNGVGKFKLLINNIGKMYIHISISTYLLLMVWYEEFGSGSEFQHLFFLTKMVVGKHCQEYRFFWRDVKCHYSPQILLAIYIVVIKISETIFALE